MSGSGKPLQKYENFLVYEIFSVSFRKVSVFFPLCKSKYGLVCRNDNPGMIFAVSREDVRITDVLTSMNQPYALITGASSGIGFQYARVLASRGYNLLIVSNEEAIHDRADELRNEFPATEVVSLVRDLSLQPAAEELHDYCKQNGLEVEVLVNNAGVYHDRDFLDDSLAFNSIILNLHMYTPAMLCYHFGQDMVARGKGYILNMCSITSHMAAQRLGAYGSTKAFLRNFTRALHVELHEKGVKVLNVNPGAVNTGLYNIPAWVTRLGKGVGFIVEPDYLARRAVRALFRGRAKVTIPTFWSALLVLLVLMIPTCLLKLIRRWRLF